MKISWGKGIVVSIIIFVLITAVMVWIAFMQKVDLVANNYYDKEIKYQDQIELMKNSSSLKEKISVKQDGNSIEILFPASLDFSNAMGQVKFYRPSDSGKDFSLPLKLDSNGKMFVSSEQISKGLWKVQLNWTLNNKNYFNQESVIVQ